MAALPISTAELSQRRQSLDTFADASLKAAARLWFVVAVIGQLVFVCYVVSFYGGAAARGDMQSWNRSMTHGYIPSDTMGNFAVAIHLFLGVLVIAGGAIQLIPQVRERAPSFHRWNGRIYLLTAFTISIAGLYMIWVRGFVGDVLQHIGLSINAILIMLCAALALRYALARKFGVHRRWALRLFLVVNGVWFFRVGLMLWLFLNHGSAGFDPRSLRSVILTAGAAPVMNWSWGPETTFQGPFLTFLSFAQYLAPLAVLELYLRTRDGAGTTGRMAMAVGLVVLTVAMGVGIFAASMGMWLPYV